MNLGQTGSSGQHGNSGGSSDWRTWALGVVSAGLAGLGVLAVEKQQWIWFAAAIVLTVATMMFLAQLKGSGNAKMAVSFLVVGVVLGLVATFGFVQLRTGKGGSTAGVPEPPGTSTPESGPAELQVTFDTPADRETVPIGGTLASGAVTGPVPSGSSMWLVKFSADNGGRHFIAGQIVPMAGRWSTPTEQIGGDDAAENGRIFALQVVIAGPAAAEAMTPSEATREQGFAELPAGAKIIAERSIVRR